MLHIVPSPDADKSGIWDQRLEANVLVVPSKFSVGITIN